MSAEFTAAEWRPAVYSLQLRFLYVCSRCCRATNIQIEKCVGRLPTTKPEQETFSIRELSETHRTTRRKQQTSLTKEFNDPANKLKLQQQQHRLYIIYINNSKVNMDIKH